MISNGFAVSLIYLSVSAAKIFSEMIQLNNPKAVKRVFHEHCHAYIFKNGMKR